jgi:hypothetical protein
MQGIAGNHQTAADLESYSLGTLALSLISGFDQHLFVCHKCRAELDAIEPYGFVHYTGDGPFYSRATRLRTGMLFARHWGRGLEGGLEFRTREGAKSYLVQSFSLMFPDHACTAGCGSTKYN